MILYAALYVNGVEEGPRLPINVALERGRITGQLHYVLRDAVTLGPSENAGEATVRFFPDKTTKNHIFEAGTAPPLIVEPPDPAAPAAP